MFDKNPIKGQISRDALQFLTFSISVVLILLFFYVNIYVLPLGTTSVTGALEHASSLSDMEIGVFGEICYLDTSEFLLLDPSSEAVLEAVWLGDVSLPLNGTPVIAEGRLIISSSSPILMCESVSPQSEITSVYQNPWTLPVIRLFSVIFLWFILMISLAGISSFYIQFRRNILLRNRMRAFSEIGIFSGIIMLLLALLSISESDMIDSLSISSYAALFSIALLMFSVLMRRVQNPEITELADSIPIIAWFSILFSIPLTLIEIQILYRDLLIEVLIEQLFIHPISLIAGAIGFLLLGLYLAGRKYEIFTARTLLAYIQTEVKKY